jgi:hypothetical protein
MIAALRSCPQKLFREYIEHWKPKTQSVHLVAGAAFADGIETAKVSHYRDGIPPAEALAKGVSALWAHYGSFQCPEDSAKDPLRMAQALDYYFSVWPLGQDPATPRLIGEKHGIEFSFATPLEILHPQSGDPLIYTGRADQIADYASGIFLGDEKTTTQLGPTWSRQWDLRSQFTSYCWQARAYGFPVDGVLVRGIAIRKTGFDHAEALTYRPQWQIDRWYYQTMNDLRRAIGMWRLGYWDYDLDHACVEYGGCLFRQICTVAPQQQAGFLDLYFERRRWDPLTREEIKL